ncbi:conserved hypothetical protein, partial [Trichinella spiralis]|uniref:hypothetical protein n=1 Tax=Trichinella spiralis TaxID=6334 RepID=UPI0001EFD8E3
EELFRAGTPPKPKGEPVLEGQRGPTPNHELALSRPEFPWREKLEPPAGMLRPPGEGSHRLAAMVWGGHPAGPGPARGGCREGTLPGSLRGKVFGIPFFWAPV